MTNKRMTIITRETREILTVRRASGRAFQLRCPFCDAEVEMFTPEEAAVLMNVSPRLIYRQMEEGPIHFMEEPGLPLLVCPNSFQTARNSSVRAQAAPALNPVEEL